MSDDRIAELERRVAALEGRTESLERVERELLDAARQWARLTKLGHYIEDGCITHVGQGDRSNFENLLLGRMKRAALDMLNLEAKPR